MNRRSGTRLHFAGDRLQEIRSARVACATVLECLTSIQAMNLLQPTDTNPIPDIYLSSIGPSLSLPTIFKIRGLALDAAFGADYAQ